MALASADVIHAVQYRRPYLGVSRVDIGSRAHRARRGEASCFSILHVFSSALRCVLLVTGARPTQSTCSVNPRSMNTLSTLDRSTVRDLNAVASGIGRSSRNAHSSTTSDIPYAKRALCAYDYIRTLTCVQACVERQEPASHPNTGTFSHRLLAPPTSHLFAPSRPTARRAT